MTTSTLKPFSARVLVPALALFAIMQACGGSNYVVAQEAADPIEGVWEGAVSVTHCSTGAVLATFMGSNQFHRGGTMSDTNSSPTATRGPGFGTWTKSGSAYTVKFRFFAYDAAGVLVGTRRVTRAVTLAADGRTATGTNTNELFNPAGVLIATQCGTDTATRVL